MTVIVVYVEHSSEIPLQASLECLGAAYNTGCSVVAVLTGYGAHTVAAGLGRYGVSRVVVLKGNTYYSPGATAAGLAEVSRQEKARACIAGALSTGRDLIPRVAVHLDSTVFADCTDLLFDGEAFRVRRFCFSQRYIATFRAHSPVLCATLSPTRFRAFYTGNTVLEEVWEMDLKAPSAERIMALAVRRFQPSIEKAGTIIVGGRLLNQEGFLLLEELAATLGGSHVCATEGAVNRGFDYPRVGGWHGEKVAPRLCFAVAFDWLDTSREPLADVSGVIVAISEKAEKDDIEFADYVITGNPLEVLPSLIEKLRNFRLAT